MRELKHVLWRIRWNRTWNMNWKLVYVGRISWNEKEPRNYNIIQGFELSGYVGSWSVLRA